VNQSTLTMTPGGKPLGQSLGFEAATVIVDNYTSSYVVLVDAGKTIPPWYQGATIPLPVGIRQANAKLVATTPAIPGPPVPTTQATLIWTDVALPADPGHPLQQVTAQQQTVVGTVTAGAGATVNADFPVPAGSLAIGFAVRSQADPTNPGHFFDTPQLVTIFGDQTGLEYFGTGAATNTSVLSAPFDTSDTTVAVSVKGNAANRSQVDFLAWPILPAVSVRSNPGDLPISAVITDPSGNFLDIDNPGVGEFELGVSMFRATAAPWQRPTSLFRIGASIAAGGDLTLVAANANVTLYLFDLSLGLDAVIAGGPVVLQDDGGTNLHDFEGATLVPNPFRGRGFNLAKGKGVKLHNFAGGAAAVRGSLLYTPA